MRPRSLCIAVLSGAVGLFFRVSIDCAWDHQPEPCIGSALFAAILGVAVILVDRQSDAGFEKSLRDLRRPKEPK